MPCTARSTMSERPTSNTTRRCSSDVALNRWKMTLGAPSTASTVRSIRSSRARQITWMVTSSGIRSSSTMRRMKSKSDLEAAGKPTSISAKPTSEEKLVHPQLLVDVHRLDQRLVAVAQVHAAPARRPIDDLARPLPLRQRDGLKGTVLVKRHAAASPPGAGGCGASIRYDLLAHDPRVLVDSGWTSVSVGRVPVVWVNEVPATPAGAAVPGEAGAGGGLGCSRRAHYSPRQCACQPAGDGRGGHEYPATYEGHGMVGGIVERNVVSRGEGHGLRPPLRVQLSALSRTFRA